MAMQRFADELRRAGPRGQAERDDGLRGLLAALFDAKIEFLMRWRCGGYRAWVSPPDRDLDVVYRRTPDNSPLVSALKDFCSLPPRRASRTSIPWDEETIAKGLNFSLTTSYGELDLLGETGRGDYDELLPHTIVLDLFGIECAASV